MNKIDLGAVLGGFSEHWSPRVVAALNGQHVKVARLLGEFVWHHHDDEDELFLVLDGRFTMHVRDRVDDAASERRIELGAGEMLVVPRSVEHKPVASEEAHVLLFEPASTINTGNVRDERTILEPPHVLPDVSVPAREP